MGKREPTWGKPIYCQLSKTWVARNKQTNIKPGPFLPLFPGLISHLHPQLPCLLLLPRAVQGRMGLWPVHKTSWLLVLPHTFLHGWLDSPQAAGNIRSTMELLLLFRLWYSICSFSLFLFHPPLSPSMAFFPFSKHVFPDMAPSWLGGLAMSCGRSIGSSWNQLCPGWGSPHLSSQRPHCGHPLPKLWHLRPIHFNSANRCLFHKGQGHLLLYCFFLQYPLVLLRVCVMWGTFW